MIRGARIVIGDGRVIESGSVLIKDGKIIEVYPDLGPDPEKLKVEAVDGAGKTLLPGLIDVHVHLGAPGGLYSDMKDYNAQKAMERELAAYLYSGVTAVKSVGDWQSEAFTARARINGGQRLGAELFACGPMFTTEGGHGTEYIEYMPEMIKATARQQLVRTPKSAAEARDQVRALKQAGADGIKAILESGRAGMLFEKMDIGVLKAVGEEARAQKLPLVVHTGGSRDIADAIDAGAVGLEHGSMTDEIPDALLERIAKTGVAYDPTLTVVHAYTQSVAGQTELLNRTLVQQVAPPRLIDETKRRLQERDTTGPKRAYARACENLRRAHRAGVMLVTGSDAGNPLVIHGPTVHQEMQLWVAAGIPAGVALQAATGNAARLLGAANRIGRIAKGLEANLLLVDGNPLVDIAATERISLVVFKGERIRRSKLFDQK
jgi:imidazolonepropionase-like amidohydrolase